jgi:F-type H+-transporting ATPase subunit epsilon
MLSVSGGECTLVPTTFEWSDKIDLKRAEAAYDRADKILKSGTATDTEIALAQARLHRALVRKSVVSYK